MVAICSKCERSFHNKSNLNRHMKVVHSENSESESSDEELNETIEQSESEISLQNESNGSSDESEGEGEETMDVWPIIAEEAAHYEGNVLEAYKQNVLFCRGLKNDEIHQKVMGTLKRATDEEEDMDFEEALDYAIDKRKYAILKVVQEAHDHNEEEWTLWQL